ncbi:hypothetical protein Cs7R123_33220 [Catellatospora sp. TT07R-123]|uniref:hypothetical protein n=1 Tax=Catellatospora sp. TT07R-123 TaxID=2733863 RepID=UPI001AFD284E|nr:hypothetical protein [Catellatospora sp. TT07R-123]GHJ45980.1 hypothetical protein Cs7R123_33220 [Catellatospora sp. TT07R-123]
MSTEQLRRAADLLANQVGHWTPARWADRGESMHLLVQRVADQAADLGGTPRRAVPRLTDLALADQLRVVVGELISLAPAPDLVASTTADIAALRHTLDT